AAVDSIFRRVHAKNVAKKFESSFPVPVEVCQHLANIEVALAAESPCIEQNVARNRHAVDGAADVDIRKVKRFSVECNKALRPDLPDIRPEVGQQFPLIILAVHARAIQFEPMDSDADNPSGAGIEAETIQYLDR